nr:hypothetical protein BaRGS_002717 [Batillaria attramentaria]
MAQPDQVPFPPDLPNWGLVRDMLTELQERLLNETINAQDAALHIQEEIRFSTCPELIVAMVFMENMEENEAIIISGFEQFAQCTGYAASLQYAGPFHDHAQRDPSGNLLNTLCAIDATSFRWGGHRRQYMDSFVMREVNKAYASRDDGNNHSHGGNGERLSLPMIIPRPQNGSCDLLEVDYTEWLANFRRRSSQLSDLTSRRSSSSTKHSSEFSSDLEEIYETLVQAEKAQHGIIEEETYGAALSDYAASFVSSLMQEGTSVAAQMMPDMKDFQQGQLPVGVHRPQVLRPAGVRFGGDNGSSDIVSVAEFEHDAALEEEDQDLSVSDGAAGRLQCISVKALCRIDMYVQNLVEKETRKGLKEAAESISSGGPEPSTQDESISDDVYVWFADKIVHEVFSQAVDDLYFQRFTSDSRWRAELSVNREGVYRRASYEERKDSLSSSSSCSSGLRESFDSQSKNSSSLSSHSAESDVLAAAQKKAKSITCSYEVAAAVIGASEKGNVVTESYMQTKTGAGELMNADTSVPQLFLMSSGSTASTTESRRSSMSGFRDTTLATFESELLNSSFGQTPSSPRHHRPKRSQSRESRLWKSDSSETEYWFPIPRRVGSEFQEEMERLNRHYSVDEIEDYADFIANTILQQAVTILHHDMEEVTQEDEDISIFSENLADQIMREALVGSARLSRQQPRRPPTVQSASGSEFDLSLSSNDLTGRSLEDRLTDFQDALDIPFNRLEAYAVKLAHSILSSVLDEFGATLVRTYCLTVLSDDSWVSGGASAAAAADAEDIPPQSLFDFLLTQP